MEERVTRWASTCVFLACAFGLMFVLGGTFSPWLGLAAGTVVFGAVAGPLWSRHLDRRA